MRTLEKFNEVYEEAKRFTHWHGFVWIVPMEDSYAISVIEPDPSDLPKGTSAVSMEYDSGTKDWAYARIYINSSLV